MKKVHLVSVLAGMGLLVMAHTVWAQQGEHEKHHPKSDAAPTPDASPKSGMMMDQCKMMGGKMMDMKEMMEKMDQDLDATVKKMNESTGDAKVEAMAAVINELVSQREHMQGMQASMQRGMMAHMAEHMMSGKGMAGMTACPMMQSAPDDKADKPEKEDKHEGHH